MAVGFRYMNDEHLKAEPITETATDMKKNRSTKAQGKPRGWIFGARWSTVPVQARACRVTVGIAPKNWWCHGMEGQERRAIEVKLDGQTVYVDNQDGWALSVFLRGIAPLPKFRFVPVFFVSDDPESEVFYKAKVDLGG